MTLDFGFWASILALVLCGMTLKDMGFRKSAVFFAWLPAALFTVAELVLWWL